MLLHEGPLRCMLHAPASLRWQVARCQEHLHEAMDTVGRPFLSMGERQGIGPATRTGRRESVQRKGSSRRACVPTLGTEVLSACRPSIPATAQLLGPLPPS